MLNQSLTTNAHACKLDIGLIDDVAVWLCSVFSNCAAQAPCSPLRPTPHIHHKKCHGNGGISQGGVGASHGRVSFGALALLGKAAHGTSLGLRRDHGGLHLGKKTIGTKETLHTTETIGTRRHMAALKGNSKNSRQKKGKHIRTASTLEETSLAPSVQQRKRSSSAIRQAHRSQKLAQPPGRVPH